MAARSRADVSVVIVGGGFAGVACAKELATEGVKVTLVDQHNYTQFQPLLYQVATAQVTTDGVARPLRGVFRKYKSVDVKMAEVTSVDAAAKTVMCADGTTFNGDYLVLAAGAQPNFFHTPGADTHAFPLYALADAERLRSRVFQVFEDADRDPKLLDRGALNFVIVGAGATGVETAGALADLLNDAMPKRFHDLSLETARIHVVDPAPVVLAPFSDKAHAYAKSALEKKGVHLDLGVSVSKIAPDRVVLSDGREILTRTVIWAGGIQAAAVAAQTGLPSGHRGRRDGGGVSSRLRTRRCGQHPGSRRQAVPTTGIGGPASGTMVGREHPR
jgi:NADH dehydrogenase